MVPTLRLAALSCLRRVTAPATASTRPHAQAVRYCVVFSEKALLNLEGVGAAVLGGGADADVVAAMHGLSRSLRFNCCVAVAFCGMLIVEIACAVACLTLNTRSLQRTLSVAADIHMPCSQLTPSLLTPLPPPAPLPHLLTSTLCLMNSTSAISTEVQRASLSLSFCPQEAPRGASTTRSQPASGASCC
jgi:hypothetical protein